MTKLPIVHIVGEPDADPTALPESVVHEIWRLQRFHTDDMQTVDGRRLVVLDPGRLNENQGPDFLNARIVVGSTTWAGSIEIHRTSSDWIRHKHHQDPHYRAVILHVTLVADQSTGRLERADGSLIPEVVLYPRLRDSLRKLHWQFRKGGRLFFACGQHWMDVPDDTIAPFLRRLATERLAAKALRMGERFVSMPDLNQVLYEEVFRCLGYSQNAEAMVLLARRIPRRALESVPDPRDAAALLLGSAGLLTTKSKPRPSTPFDVELQSRYEALDVRDPPLPATIWRHARLRPANSPQRRILQAVLLFSPSGSLGRHPVDSIASLLDAPRPLPTLRDTLRIESDVATYLDPSGSMNALALGLDQQVTIAANALLPALLVRAEHLDASDALDRAVTVLRRLPVVMDHIVRRYSAVRGRPTSSAVTQGLHELSSSWCGRGRCRECPIWKHIARSDMNDQSIDA